MHYDGLPASTSAGPGRTVIPGRTSAQRWAWSRSPGDGLSAAEAAYDQVAGEPSFRTRSFAWTCPACHGTVIDRGPEAGRPQDCEEGHADGCPRLAAAITAWDASWNTEDAP